MNRVRWVQALAVGAVVVAGAGVVVLRGGDGGDHGIPVLAGASRTRGELGDGVHVPEGTELVADVLPAPSVHAPFPGREGEGWEATLLLLGDPTAVLDDLAAQAEGLGLVLHDEPPFEAGCEASEYQPPEGLVVCRRAWLGDGVWLRAEAWRGVVPAGPSSVTDRPVSLLFVEHARPVAGGPTNPGPGPIVSPSTISGLTSRPLSQAGVAEPPSAGRPADEAPPAESPSVGARSGGALSGTGVRSAGPLADEAPPAESPSVGARSDTALSGTRTRSAGPPTGTGALSIEGPDGTQTRFDGARSGGAPPQADEAPLLPDPGPGGWPELPGPGDHVGDGITPPDDRLVLSLRIPEGARSVVAPWPTGGNARNHQAILAVDEHADAGAVMADLSAQVHDWFGADATEETDELAGARRHAVRGDQAGGSKLELVATTLGERTWITVATGYD